MTISRHRIIEEDLERITADSIDFAKFEGRRILVTGAYGFLASYLVETLLYLNEKRNFRIEVLGLVRNKEFADARFAHYRGRKDLRFIVQDAADFVPLDGPLDYVIHAASHGSPVFFGRDPVGTIMPNAIGTHHLLSLAHKKHCKGFLFFSSGEVYGQLLNERSPVKETDFGYLDPMQVRSCYAESKRLGETLCVSWMHQYGVPVKIARPFHTYGPGMRRNDGRVFADFVANIVQDQDIVMKSDGSAVRAYCYSEDATRAFFRILLQGQAGQAYNVGNPNAQISVLDLAETLVKLFPEKNLKVKKVQADQSSGYLKSPITKTSPDITKLETLGWSPKYSVSEGFRRTVESYL